MNLPACYTVGIDVSKNTLDLAILRRGHSHKSAATQSMANDADGHQAIIDALRQQQPIERIVLEATGGYERGIAAALQHAGFTLALVNPKRVRNYARALGILAKTDRIDACVLARFAADVEPEPTPAQTPAQQRRAELVARHRQLVKMRAAELTRRHHLTDPLLRDTSDNILAVLTAQIDRLAAELDQLIAQDPHSKPVTRVLRQVKGVGPGTARTLIAHLPELGRVSRQRIAALVGVAPFNDDSGMHTGARRIQGGRAHVRAILYMATLTATRCNPIIRDYFQRLRKRGEAFKYAMTACMRKLLIHLNGLLANHYAAASVA